MEKGVFEKKLSELVKEIHSAPVQQRAKLVNLAKQAYNCHKQLRKSVDNLQETLDYLRVSVKYLVFDLEATRRENARLKKLFEDGNS